MVLHEIPGALERPADCGIIVRKDDRVTTIEIPPSHLSRPVLLGGAFYGVLLLLFVVTGIVLYTTGKAILILHWIAIDQAHPNFSPPFRRFIPWSIPIWAALTWIGSHVLLSILRPALQHEEITIAPAEITYQRRFLRTNIVRHFAQQNVQGFLLRKDEIGMRVEILSLMGRGESVEVGEFLRPGEREWLASAGNALLRTL